ncbi:MAG: DHH family phosphoesterase [Porphyromonas sp.]|uniref:DHH family phosphoesterase n=1 Tax=Porphyromonas sp. TaxID=1924944 RepID=UPI001A627ED8|nr:DHH family phosphoesterase [Porphyromonas sp.]MBL6453487.1 DHH family phosphoesterase [Porphyromonas sp.]
MAQLSSTPLSDALEVTSLGSEGERRVVIVGHKSPDGDCIGSALALRSYLLARGADEVSIMVVGHVPDNLLWLPGAETIHQLTAQSDLEPIRQALGRARLLLLVDFNHLGRIGNPLEGLVAEVIGRPEVRSVMIDHHPEPEMGLVSEMYSDTSACATGYLIAELLGSSAPRELELYGGADMATCLLAATYTDTGLLRHGQITPALFRRIATLMELGARHDEVVLRIFKSDKLSRQRLLGFIIDERTTYDLDLGVAVFALRQEDFDRFGVEPGDTEGLVNVPLDVAGIRAVAFLREQRDPEEPVKVSLRSQGNLPVNEVASKLFGGGGHLNAAGAEYQGSLADALALVWQGLRELVDRYPECEIID